MLEQGVQYMVSCIETIEMGYPPLYIFGAYYDAFM